jgi:hypothetical protein
MRQFQGEINGFRCLKSACSARLGANDKARHEME